MTQAVDKLLRPVMAVGAAFLASACDLRHSAVLDPKGPIALAQRDLLFDAFYVMMVVIVPIIVLTLAFAWRYRASNTKATYAPKWAESVRIDAATWLVPALIVVAVAVLVWRSTHKLDPYRPIDAAVPPLDVQVVAQDWKWLFIYPEQGIAVVNQLAFPSGRPVSLRITSDTVMNSFYVPQLAGQIYAMAGMQTRLQLLADQPGKFVGRNSMYSGGGFSDQHFEVVAMTQPEFDAWVAKARQAPAKLDAATYAALATKSRLNPITFYSAVEPKLFDGIIAKYTHAHHAPAAGTPAGAAPRR
ncbi:MAG: ubiquinol oxidase subunit II [Reyranella sp.]|uniref:ubiquinol oxidase subunit II n=1 Tax=Reyranella sp. TaxID=1929291 RepID=UPI0027319EB1|nr:ubiquinol oxidase subunit II [Reyranella sp.]MDP1966603.1 ubiquinol oxidase subunit II [Reyranella sp.]MDP2372476.1 ubiquinol oxidase subunit II [Reyranella sp.]